MPDQFSFVWGSGRLVKCEPCEDNSISVCVGSVNLMFSNEEGSSQTVDARNSSFEGCYVCPSGALTVQGEVIGSNVRVEVFCDGTTQLDIINIAIPAAGSCNSGTLSGGDCDVPIDVCLAADPTCGLPDAGTCPSCAAVKTELPFYVLQQTQAGGAGTEASPLSSDLARWQSNNPYELFAASGQTATRIGITDDWNGIATMKRIYNPADSLPGSSDNWACDFVYRCASSFLEMLTNNGDTVSPATGNCKQARCFPVSIFDDVEPDGQNGCPVAYVLWDESAKGGFLEYPSGSNTYDEFPLTNFAYTIGSYSSQKTVPNIRYNNPPLMDWRFSTGYYIGNSAVWVDTTTWFNGGYSNDGSIVGGQWPTQVEYDGSPNLGDQIPAGTLSQFYYDIARVNLPSPCGAGPSNVSIFIQRKYAWRTTLPGFPDVYIGGEVNQTPSGMTIAIPDKSTPSTVLDKTGFVAGVVGQSGNIQNLTPTPFGPEVIDITLTGQL